jgi:tripartite ATP-independent transporter DctM subunit
LEWYWMLLLIIGGLLLMMVTGMPVAYAFMIVIIVGGFLLTGGGGGIEQAVLNIKGGLTTFTLLPIPLFILMGEVIFQSKISPNMINALDGWIGRLPGRLGLISIGGGVLFSTLTGSSAASVAMLGSTLVPEMEKRGYKKSMSLGPILGSGGLAMMIPPSGIAVLLGAIGEINIGQILIAIIIPGLLMAALYAIYVLVRCWMQPDLAPSYDVPPTPIINKLLDTARYILPIGFIIFLVVGVIFLGIATPTEAAATGALGTFILAAAYKQLNWKMLKKTLTSTLKASGMVLFIMAGAAAYANLLAFSGASSGLSKFAAALSIEPILLIIVFLVVSLFLGCFMGPAAIMMITLPIFAPIIRSMGFSDVWFAVLFLLSIEMGQTTPPYGMALFVMKAVAPPDTTMGDCIRAAMPFLGCDLVALILILIFPAIALWLPSMMSM